MLANVDKPNMPTQSRGHGTQLVAHLSLLVLISYPLFFHHLSQRDLWSSHEARAAQMATSMLETGSWLLPRLLNGQVEMQKPPMCYWLVAAAAWLQGGQVDALAVRLPAALAALGTMIVVYLFLFLHGRPVAGLLAALMLGTMVHFTWLARVGRIDMPLTFVCTLALCCVYSSLRSSASSAVNSSTPSAHGSRAIIGYIALAAAVLLKGPIGLLLPLLVIAAFAFLSRPHLALPAILRCLLFGLPVVLLLALPWFLYANNETGGEFFREFFLYHNVQRGLGGVEALEVHPWWHYFPRLFVDLFPWSFLLPFAVVAGLRNRSWRHDPEFRFGFVWLGAIFLFLSCMRFKRADYLLPAYPGAALMLGCFIEKIISRKGRRVRCADRPSAACSISSSAQRTLPNPPLRGTLITLLAAGILLCSLGWPLYIDLVLPRLEPAREHQRFAKEIRRRVPSPGIVILFRVEPFPLEHHLGKSFDHVWEWENLDTWAGRPLPAYVVTTPQTASQWPTYLKAGRLYPVCSNSELADCLHEQPLVLLCTCPVDR